MHTTDRILALDVTRGVAVLGILLANLPGFALPEPAYFSPVAWGRPSGADLAVWAATFVLVEGKMRGLFTVLFGASALLVADRATAAGRSAGRTHYARMATLYLFGVAHLYLFWWGDILAHYALCGAIAFLFAGLPVGGLLAAGTVALGWEAVQGAVATQLAFGDAAPGLLHNFGAATHADMLDQARAIGGGFGSAAAWRWRTLQTPLDTLPHGGPETIGYMLWGMAGLRSGFLAGGWERRRYARIAAVTLPLGWAGFAALAVSTWHHGFDPRRVLLGSIGVSAVPRALLIAGYACLVMLLMRPGGWLTERLAAAGRVAFSNYLGTTLVMTAIFSGWGLGLFGRLGRAETYLLVPAAWAIMLLWPRPWLARHAHGPLEGLWRRLTRALA